MKFKKILIANRGEIAVRILRTCKELGIQTVSVHSTADESSLHVKSADESVCIGPPKSSLSYLNIPAILSAAEITGAEAIHPGFGFLSENKEFAELCNKWELEFIGPKPDCLGKMGDKINSKILAKKAGLPVLHSIEVKYRERGEILKEVKELGFPVIIKASAGGGGRGMKVVENETELFDAIPRLEQEAKAGFGNDTLFIEKYIRSPRHIEVQILADRFGQILHLGERDCTIQRRFQKILEESPSPILSQKKRDEICSCAVNLAKYVDYDSAGTVEFLFDQDSQNFYFMEMNTRIQVEHPITEQRTGIDIVAQQIMVAQNERIKFQQSDINFSGHAIECRLNAEDPVTQFPCPGKIQYYYRPAGIGIRVDDFIYSRYSVPPFYDSLLAKIIAYAPTRVETIERMRRALDEFKIEGVKTTIPFHLAVLHNKNFYKGRFTTNFIEKNNIMDEIKKYYEHKRKELTNEKKVIIVSTAVAKYIERKNGSIKANSWTMAGRQELMENEI